MIQQVMKAARCSAASQDGRFVLRLLQVSWWLYSIMAWEIYGDLSLLVSQLVRVRCCLISIFVVLVTPHFVPSQF